jgi:hypothetical protein
MNTSDIGQEKRNWHLALHICREAVVTDLTYLRRPGGIRPYDVRTTAC